MTELRSDGGRGTTAMTRRTLLAQGLALSGAMFAGIPKSTAAVGPTAWAVDPTVTSSLKALGKTIIVDKNFYGGTTFKYADASDWQFYVQEDVGGATWQVGNRSFTVPYIIRIPYFVTFRTKKVLDNILVGYSEILKQARDPNASDAWDPAPNATGVTPDDYQTLGMFLMYDRNPYFANPANPTVAMSTSANAVREFPGRVKWTFRDTAVRIEKAVTYLYRVREDGWHQSLLLIGYEGAGGY